MDVRTTAPGQGWVALGDFVLVHCTTLITSATVRALIGHSARHTGPSRLAIVYVFEGPAMGVPDEQCRADYIELSKYGERVYSSAAVVVPAGFTAAVARAFVGGVRMASRAKLPVDIFSSIDDALSFTRARIAPGSVMPPRAIIDEAIDALRRRNEPHGSPASVG